MTDWPRYTGNIFGNFITTNYLEESKVVLQLFSGRENPSISLRQILKDPANAKALTQIKRLVQEALASPEKRTELSQKHLKDIHPSLGSRSVIIVDSEGVISPRNSIIEMRENFIKITFKDGKSIILNSKIARDLQQHLMAELCNRAFGFI